MDIPKTYRTVRERLSSTVKESSPASSRAAIVLRAIEKSPEGSTVLEAGSRRLIVAYADEILHDAITNGASQHSAAYRWSRRDNPQKIVGYPGRACIMDGKTASSRRRKPSRAGWRQRFSQ
jgi:hypothetical protein